MQFTHAVRSQSKLRMALAGPSGSGKTFTALVAATEFAGGGKIAFVDTEHGSASKYAGRFSFDVLELTGDYHPHRFRDALKAAEAAGYPVVVLDSITHAWNGTNGVLEQVEMESKRKGGNKYAAWDLGTKIHNDLINAILGSNCHVICTMRSKMAYLQEEGKDGKKTIRKVGMEPVQRDGMEYEFDVIGDLDIDHTLIISKSRIDVIADKVVNKPGPEFFAIMREWLNGGAPAKPRTAAKPAAKSAPEPEQEAAPEPDEKRVREFMEFAGSDLIDIARTAARDTYKRTNGKVNLVEQHLGAGFTFDLLDAQNLPDETRRALALIIVAGDDTK